MQDLNKIKKTNRIKLPIFKTLYSLLFYYNLIIMIMLMSLFLLDFQRVYEDNPNFTVVVVILFAVFFIVLIHSTKSLFNKSKLTLIHANIKNVNLDLAIEKVAERTKFDYKKVSEFEYKLERGRTFWSFGDTITVITYDNKLFANNFQDIHPTFYDFDKTVIPNFEKAFNDIIQNDSDVIFKDPNNLKS